MNQNAVVNEDACLLKDSCLFKQSGLYDSGLPMFSKKEKWFLYSLFGSIIALVFFLAGLYAFVMIYPFKTVQFFCPAEILNPGKKVPVNGVVHLKFNFQKFINAKGLIIRTLIRVHGDELDILDSNTAVSNRPASPGPTTAEGFFYLSGNPEMIGPKCKILFSVYYTVYGVRTILRQYESEFFEIVPVTPK